MDLQGEEIMAHPIVEKIRASAHAKAFDKQLEKEYPTIFETDELKVFTNPPTKDIFIRDKVSGVSILIRSLEGGGIIIVSDDDLIKRTGVEDASCFIVLPRQSRRRRIHMNKLREVSPVPSFRQIQTELSAWVNSVAARRPRRQRRRQCK